MDLVNDSYEIELMEEELDEYHNKLKQRRKIVRQKLKELMGNEFFLHQYHTWDVQKDFSCFLGNVINHVCHGSIRPPGELDSDLHYASMPEKAMAYILQQPMEVWKEFDTIMDDTFIQQCIDTDDIEDTIKNEKDLLLAIGTLVVAGYKDKKWNYYIEEDINVGHLIEILEKRYYELFNRQAEEKPKGKQKEESYSPALPENEIPF